MSAWPPDGADCLPVFHWQPDPAVFGISVNFGDSLFPLIVERILGHAVPCVDERYPGRKLLAGGSALHCAHDDDVVWGVGLRTEVDFETHPRFERLHVSAVRGPLTRAFLRRRYAFDVPEVYGDPAVLLPQLFPEWKPAPVTGRVGLVPHFTMRDAPRELSERVRLILPNRPPHEVVRDILGCEFVVAGSLHGLIVAEAFGIPARWLNESASEPELKYYDYYQGTDRHPRPARTVVEAESLGGEPAPRTFNADRLLQSFPRAAVTRP